MSVEARTSIPMSMNCVITLGKIPTLISTHTLLASERGGAKTVAKTKDIRDCFVRNHLQYRSSITDPETRMHGGLHSSSSRAKHNPRAEKSSVFFCSDRFVDSAVLQLVFSACAAQCRSANTCKALRSARHDRLGLLRDDTAQHNVRVRAKLSF
jgi:hypothetical protein